MCTVRVRRAHNNDNIADWHWPLAVERRTKPFSSRLSCNFRCTAERRRYLQQGQHESFITLYVTDHRRTN